MYIINYYKITILYKQLLAVKYDDIICRSSYEIGGFTKLTLLIFLERKIQFYFWYKRREISPFARIFDFCLDT